MPTRCTGDLMRSLRRIKIYAWRWSMFMVSSRTPSALKFERRMQVHGWIHPAPFVIPLLTGLALQQVLPAPWGLWSFIIIVGATIACSIRRVVLDLKMSRRLCDFGGACCAVCGYDLRGVPQHDSVTESGRCPECGAPFSIAATRKMFGLPSRSKSG